MGGRSIRRVESDILTTPETVDATASITVLSINDDPLLDDLIDLTIDEDAPLQTVDLTGISAGGIDWRGGEPQDLRITATSSDTDLFDDPVVIYTSADPTGRIQFTPKPDRYGTAVVTITVEDAGLDNDFSTNTDPSTVNLTVTKSFTVTVDPVNDVPSTTDKDFTTDEDTSLTITAAELYAGSAGDADPMQPAPQDESNQTFRIVALRGDRPVGHEHHDYRSQCGGRSLRHALRPGGREL